MNATASIVSRVWSFCTTLRDDGVGYGDYLEQLTYLIFLKMADEYSRPPYSRQIGIPENLGWASLKAVRGAALEVHYVTVLRELGNKPGLLGQIFTKAQNKIQDPAKLSRLIDMVDETQWVMLGADVKGDIYEGLLERNAEDTKSGAGQYFTPRPLIRAMVECMRPLPNKTIADPACGTGGFFLAAYDFLVETYPGMDREQRAFLKHDTFFGNEIVAGTRRLALMNMFLHNIGEIDGDSPISPNDALIAPPQESYDYVLANPPFGKKSSMTITNEEGEEDRDALTYERQDFWQTTSNKQLNFLQHIVSMLKVDGKAAVVLPDNVLFEGGAGERIRRKLLATCDVHTILRLPTGIFYAQGVKTNVLFFTRGAGDQGNTREVAFYDLRTNMPSFGKTHPLSKDDFAGFIAAYEAADRHAVQDERWHIYTREEIAAKDDSLDLGLIKDAAIIDYEDLPDPAESARAASNSLREAAALLDEIAAELRASKED